MARNSRIKKKKNQIVFDEKERREYLTGFRKRKEERRRKARDELERQIKEEKKKQKEMRLEAMRKEREKAGLPTIDEIIEKNTKKIELQNHTITISDIDNLARPKLFDSDDEKNPDKDEEEDENDSSGDEEEERKEGEGDDDDKKRQKGSKKKSALAKLNSKMSEKLIQLEKRKRQLGMLNENPLKAKKKKIAKRCSKSTKKFNKKDSKFKKKKDIKRQKYLNKKGL